MNQRVLPCITPTEHEPDVLYADAPHVHMHVLRICIRDVNERTSLLQITLLDHGRSALAVPFFDCCTILGAAACQSYCKLKKSHRRIRYSGGLLIIFIHLSS
jgi:hypothetical protein